jgi:CRP-like cAMP-binding protein
MAIDLSRIPTFADLDTQERARLAGIFAERSLKAGTVVVREEDSGDEMFILVSGNVQISKAMLLPGMSIPLLNMASPRKVLATLDHTAHPIFGEMALIDSDQRSATVLAVTDCLFLVTNRERFFGLLREDAPLGVKLLLILARRMAASIRRTNGEVVKLTTALALALRKGI